MPPLAIATDLLQIDITYRCNLRCPDCNRYCNLCPRNDDMTIEQILRFIAESKALSWPWKRVNIMGGEPTLHPNIHDIAKLLSAYAVVAKFDLWVMTNGTTDFYPPPGCLLHSSYKQTGGILHYPATIAPTDLNAYDQTNNACAEPAGCGIALNTYGFYPCPEAAALDSLTGLNVGIKQLSAVSPARLTAVASNFCVLCGRYLFDSGVTRLRPLAQADSQPITASHHCLLARYTASPPTLTRY